MLGVVLVVDPHMLELGEGMQLLAVPPSVQHDVRFGLNFSWRLRRRYLEHCRTSVLSSIAVVILDRLFGLSFLAVDIHMLKLSDGMQLLAAPAISCYHHDRSH